MWKPTVQYSNNSAESVLFDQADLNTLTSLPACPASQCFSPSTLTGRTKVKVPSREQMEAMLETNLELDTSNNSITPAHCGPASGGTFPENRISAVGASPVSSRQSGGGGGGGAPARTRATWGAPIGGDDSVATAITEKGGGLPWEEISDVLESSSSVL